MTNEYIKRSRLAIAALAFAIAGGLLPLASIVVFLVYAGTDSALLRGRLYLPEVILTLAGTVATFLALVFAVVCLVRKKGSPSLSLIAIVLAVSDVVFLLVAGLITLSTN